MKTIYDSNKKPVMLRFTISTQAPQRIRIRTFDPKKQNTFYTDRVYEISGTRNVDIRMPVSPVTSVTQIYNERNGDLPAGKDPTFTVTNKQALPLPTKLEALVNMSPDLPSWRKFSNEFCDAAGWLSTGTYYSDDVKFRIDLLPIIRNDKGQPLNTPARIHMKTGVIQASQYHMKRATVPKRKAILSHEHSHVYENQDMRNETEADLNGLIIYLAEGWPRGEAHQAFLDVFKKTPTNQNKQRYQILYKFIDRFDKINFGTPTQ